MTFLVLLLVGLLRLTLVSLMVTFKVLRVALLVFMGVMAFVLAV